MKIKRSVAVLGATGAVGQRFVQILARHPWFHVVAVSASERSAGKSYRDAVRWILPGEVPEPIGELEVVTPDPSKIDAELVFSGLDARVAEQVEPRFRDAGFVVVSNARSFRWSPGVPLVVPEINAEHLQLVLAQKARYGGAIVTNPNCSTIGLTLSLQPLREAFGVEQVLVTTMQALSGAGYPGVPSLDALDNVLPEIAGEEEKMEKEPQKIFGTLRGGQIVPDRIQVSAQCNRVAVRDGHLLSISVKLSRAATLEEVAATFDEYRSPLARLGLPSAPARPVVLESGFARPQPALDRGREGGMVVTVGRLRKCPILDYRYVALVHNTIRGAAGGTVLIAEYLVAKGLA